jgi:ABC-type transport system involved in cytochrome bd biosynthesis fused ATPase/permease subunit
MTSTALPLPIGRSMQIVVVSRNSASTPYSSASVARMTEERALWRVLELVGLDRWARALPQGLDTRVGQLGDAVSGGERQRIALARALLSPAPVLVLDEPTAHLDAVTAAVVSANLSRELHGRTVVWIRHDDDSGRARTHRCLQIGWADGREPAGSRTCRESSSAEPDRLRTALEPA